MWINGAGNAQKIPMSHRRLPFGEEKKQTDSSVGTRKNTSSQKRSAQLKESNNLEIPVTRQF